MFANPDGTGYVHRVIWSDRPCGHLCTYTYSVENAVNANGDGWQESTGNQFSISTCIN